VLCELNHGNDNPVCRLGDLDDLAPAAGDVGGTSAPEAPGTPAGGAKATQDAEAVQCENDDPPVQQAALHPAAAPRGAVAHATRLAVAPVAAVAARIPADPTRVDGYSHSLGCFLLHLGLQKTALDPPSWDNIYLVKYKINLLVAWLLPGLYGLLGACVYLMRAFVLRPADRVVLEPTLLSTLAFVLRIALGGLAGIIIGWFWVPSSSPDSALSVSSIPFGMAFLAGFSIETLFSLLDRLNRSIAGVGDDKAPPGPTPPAPALATAPAAPAAS
jgi:hypothetical protein